MQCLLHYYGDCLEIGHEYGIYSVAGVDSQLLRLTQTLPGRKRGCVVYWKDVRCSYCKCFSGFGATASLGAKKKTRREAGDGAGGCLEAVQGGGRKERSREEGGGIVQSLRGFNYLNCGLFVRGGARPKNKEN